MSTETHMIDWKPYKFITESYKSKLILIKLFSIEIAQIHKIWVHVLESVILK